MDNCVFLNNSALSSAATVTSLGAGAFGGAIVIQPLVPPPTNSSAFFRNSSFSGNLCHTGTGGIAASNAAGGAIFVEGWGNLVLTICRFTHNAAVSSVTVAGDGTALAGGAVAVVSVGNATTVTLHGCTFVSNHVEGSTLEDILTGGAVSLHGLAVATLSACLFQVRAVWGREGDAGECDELYHPRPPHCISYLRSCSAH